MKITVFGGGNMGMAYVESFLKKGICSKEDILIIDKYAPKVEDLKSKGFNASMTLDATIGDVWLVAVKPQDFWTLAEEIKPHFTKNIIVLSLMAGVDIEGLKSALDAENVIRAMPNTPALLGLGVTGFTLSNVEPELRRLSEILLGAAGSVFYFEKEEMINAVTALSGSGPAYYFYFLQHIVKAATELGINEKDALEMGLGTMKGAAALIEHSDKSLQELINSVTSRGGTTIACLDTFDAENVGKGIETGLKAAYNRAFELSKK